MHIVGNGGPCEGPQYEDYINRVCDAMLHIVCAEFSHEADGEVISQRYGSGTVFIHREMEEALRLAYSQKKNSAVLQNINIEQTKCCAVIVTADIFNIQNNQPPDDSLNINSKFAFKWVRHCGLNVLTDIRGEWGCNGIEINNVVCDYYGVLRREEGTFPHAYKFRLLRPPLELPYEPTMIRNTRDGIVLTDPALGHHILIAELRPFTRRSMSLTIPKHTELTANVRSLVCNGCHDVLWGTVYVVSKEKLTSDDIIDVAFCSLCCAAQKKNRFVYAVKSPVSIEERIHQMTVSNVRKDIYNDILAGIESMVLDYAQHMPIYVVTSKYVLTSDPHVFILEGHDVRLGVQDRIIVPMWLL